MWGQISSIGGPSVWSPTLLLLLIAELSQTTSQVFTRDFAVVNLRCSLSGCTLAQVRIPDKYKERREERLLEFYGVLFGSVDSTHRVVFVLSLLDLVTL